MRILLEGLGEKERRGSKPRCHWLTHGKRDQVSKRLTHLIQPYGLVSPEDSWMPDGFKNTNEAKLDRGTGLRMPEKIQEKLKNWWLAVSKGANTPNWDIASTCTVRDQPGLLLVEAKAHENELLHEEKGKTLRKDASENSFSNHLQIGHAISDASGRLQRETDMSWAISRDTHYQMSNRFAWAWKLNQLGYNIVFVYLGFLQATEMSDIGCPLQDHAHWSRTVLDHSDSIVPDKAWNQELNIGDKLLIPLIRSLEIAYDTPMESS